MLLAQCQAPNLQALGMSISKENIGASIVAFDIITITAVLLFGWFLNQSQYVYVNMYKTKTIEMSDFTVRVKGLPHHQQYECNDEVIRAILMAHFQRVARNEAKRQYEAAKGTLSTLQGFFTRKTYEDEPQRERAFEGGDDDFDNIAPNTEQGILGLKGKKTTISVEE